MDWLLIVTAGLILGAGGFFLGRWTSREATEPPSADKPEDSTRAEHPPELSVEIKQRDTHLKLLIASTGPSAATNIHPHLDGKPILDHEKVLTGPEPGYSLGPGSSITYDLAYGPKDRESAWNVRLEYHDVFGAAYSSEVTVWEFTSENPGSKE